MARCLVKVGFLILSDCEEPAGHTCSSCDRSVCGRHFVGEEGQCVECSAKRVAAAELDQLDDRWVHKQREKFYAETYYLPIARGHWYEGYYDDLDVRGFDLEREDPSSWSEVGGGLWDS